MFKKRTRKLRKVGDSITISIPPTFLKQMGWDEGDHIRLDIVENTIQLKINHSPCSSEQSSHDRE